MTASGHSRERLHCASAHISISIYIGGMTRILYTIRVHDCDSAVNDTLRCLDISWNKLQVAGTTAVLQALEVRRVAR